MSGRNEGQRTDPSTIGTFHQSDPRARRDASLNRPRPALFPRLRALAAVALLIAFGLVAAPPPALAQRACWHGWETIPECPENSPTRNMSTNSCASAEAACSSWAVFFGGSLVGMTPYSLYGTFAGYYCHLLDWNGEEVTGKTYPVANWSEIPAPWTVPGCLAESWPGAKAVGEICKAGDQASGQVEGRSVVFSEEMKPAAP